MSEKIVQLNREVFKGQIKELMHVCAMWPAPSGANRKYRNIKHLKAALDDASLVG